MINLLQRMRIGSRSGAKGGRTGFEMTRNIAIFEGITAALLVLSGCGGQREPDVLDELARVAGATQGLPTLVFIYTDG